VIYLSQLKLIKTKGLPVSAQWLYQIRIKVSSDLSRDLRSNNDSNALSKKIYDIAKTHQTTPVCTYDAFCGYCEEAERNGVEKYPLYSWTKETIDNPEKVKKHITSFAFYTNESQVYEESLAKKLYEDLVPLRKKNLINDLKIIDSNPKNNPQPPKKS
tara:strand:+ start:378 stop:851 length:474 start_codon:yes stop_codon:yes gene_type:complete